MGLIDCTLERSWKREVVSGSPASKGGCFANRGCAQKSRCKKWLADSSHHQQGSFWSGVGGESPSSRKPQRKATPRAHFVTEWRRQRKGVPGLVNECQAGKHDLVGRQPENKKVLYGDVHRYSMLPFAHPFVNEKTASQWRYSGFKRSIGSHSIFSKRVTIIGKDHAGGCKLPLSEAADT